MEILKTLFDFWWLILGGSSTDSALMAFELTVLLTWLTALFILGASYKLLRFILSLGGKVKL